MPKAIRAWRARKGRPERRVPKARRARRVHKVRKEIRVLPEQALSTYRCIPLRAVTFGKSLRARKPFTFTSSVAVEAAAAGLCKGRLRAGPPKLAVVQAAAVLRLFVVLSLRVIWVRKQPWSSVLAVRAVNPEQVLKVLKTDSRVLKVGNRLLRVFQHQVATVGQRARKELNLRGVLHLHLPQHIQAHKAAQAVEGARVLKELNLLRGVHLRRL